MRWRGTTAAASLRTATSASASPPAAPPLTRLTTTHHASAGAARLPSRQAARSGRAAHGLARGRLCWADGDVGRSRGPSGPRGAGGARRRAAVTRIGPWSRCRWDPAEERRSRDGPAAPRARRRHRRRAGTRRRGLRSAQPQRRLGEGPRAAASEHTGLAAAVVHLVRGAGSAGRAQPQGSAPRASRRRGAGAVLRRRTDTDHVRTMPGYSHEALAERSRQIAFFLVGSGHAGSILADCTQS